MIDLVAKLRTLVTIGTGQVTPIRLEAADTIEAQACEIAALTENFDALMIKAQEAVDGQAAALFEVVALQAENAALTARAEEAERACNGWRNDYRALEKAIVGDTGLSAMLIATQARLFKPRAEAAEAKVARLVDDLNTAGEALSWASRRMGGADAMATHLAASNAHKSARAALAKKGGGNG